MSSMPLPAALQGWAPWLSWFEPDLAAQIGPLLVRLHPLLGRFKGQRQGGLEEPDGVGDLRRKGSYERLLASEWLLATELPDEFLRRAASSEHLFLAPRLRARSADKLIVALFDTGPWQLGAPRLAQIALWILLARRAVEVGGEMRWGSLQRPGQWHGCASPEDLNRFLDARRLEAVLPEHAGQWAEWLAEHAEGRGEYWRIGHEPEEPRQAAAVVPTHVVRLRRQLQGDALEVRLKAGASLRTMQLPLPEAGAGARLLKGISLAPAPVPVRARAHDAGSGSELSLHFDPIFDMAGQRVAVPTLDESGVMIFHVATTSRHKQARTKSLNWSPRATALAIAFDGKQLSALLVQPPGQQLVFWPRPGLGWQSQPSRDEFDAAPGSGSLLPLVWTTESSQRAAFVVDASSRLVSWSARAGFKGEAAWVREPGPQLVDKDVLAVAAINERQLAYVCRDVGHVWIRYAGSRGRPSQVCSVAPDPGASTRALLACGWRWPQGFGACAVRLEVKNGMERWRVAVGQVGGQPSSEGWNAQLAPGAKAVGLVKPPADADFSLVVLSENERDLTLHSLKPVVTLFSAPAPIERISVCANTGRIAMLTRDHALLVYSTHDQALQFSTQGVPAIAKEPTA